MATVGMLQYAIIFASVFWLDQWTKNIALKVLAKIDAMFVNPLLNFSLQWNKGISFSLMSVDSTWGVLSLTAGIVVVIVLFAFYAWGQYRLGKPLYAEMLVLAGAVSNIVDRVRYGAVVDFIDVHYRDWHFATFNVADIFICLGITWLVLSQIKEVYDARTKKY